MISPLSDSLKAALPGARRQLEEQGHITVAVGDDVPMEVRRAFGGRLLEAASAPDADQRIAEGGEPMDVD